MSQVDAHAASRPEGRSETDHEPPLARARRREASPEAHARIARVVVVTLS